MRSTIPTDTLEGVDPSRPVEVYWNFRRKMFSVRQGRRVVAHVSVLLLRDVTFHVSEAGRQRVLRDGKKNVHAWAKGWVTREGWRPSEEPFKVSYNPYLHPHFLGRDSAFLGGLVVRRADLLRCSLAGVDGLSLHPSLCAQGVA